MFDGDYYILDGHHRVLAANRMNISEIEVDLIEVPTDSFWSKQENVIANMKTIGMSALFDFEAVGGFTYDKYPNCYK